MIDFRDLSTDFIYRFVAVLGKHGQIYPNGFEKLRYLPITDFIAWGELKPIIQAWLLKYYRGQIESTDNPMVHWRDNVFCSQQPPPMSVPLGMLERRHNTSRSEFTTVGLGAINVGNVGYNQDDNSDWKIKCDNPKWCEMLNLADIEPYQMTSEERERDHQDYLRSVGIIDDKDN